MSELMHLKIAAIQPQPCARAIDETIAQEIARSVYEFGLMNPVSVRIAADGKWQLIAGAHRIRAHQILGRDTINAIEFDASDERAQAMEYLENLQRSDLSVPQRALQNKWLVGYYEREIPQFSGGTTCPPENSPKIGNKSPPPQEKGASQKLAEATGATKRSINRDLARVANLGADAIAKIDGTSLGSGQQMDALARMPEPERAALIERAAAGEIVSAVPVKMLTVAEANAEVEPGDLLNFPSKLAADNGRWLTAEQSEAYDEITADYARMIEFVDANDALAACNAENKRLSARDQIQVARIGQMQGEIEERKRFALREKRRADMADKKLADYIKTHGIIIE